MDFKVYGIEQGYNYGSGGGNGKVGGVNPFQPQVQGVNGNQQKPYAQYAQYDRGFENGHAGTQYLSFNHPAGECNARWIG